MTKHLAPSTGLTPQAGGDACYNLPTNGCSRLSRILYTALTGSSACVKGLADTKQNARQLAASLSQPLNIHLTGCLRSCAAAHVAPVTLLAVAPGHYDLYLRAPEQPGFGVLCGRNLTIEAAGAWLESRQRSNTDD